MSYIYICYKRGHEPFENEIKMKTPRPDTHIVWCIGTIITANCQSVYVGTL